MTDAMSDMQPTDHGRNVSRLRDSLSDRALELVNGPRQDAYGEPVGHLRRVGEVWGGLLACDPVPPHLVALMLAGLKLVREAEVPGEDNRVDAVGYLEIAERAVPPVD